MPDMDHLPRGLKKPWRPVFDAVRGSHDSALVADRIEKALAASLRSRPEAHGYIDALCEAAEQGYQQVLAVRRSIPKDWEVGLGSGFVDAAQVVAAEGGSSKEVERRVVEMGLRRLAWQCCFAPIESSLIGTEFADAVSYSNYVHELLDEARLDVLAKKVMDQPDLSRVRAPARRNSPVGTKQLLDQPL